MVKTPPCFDNHHAVSTHEHAALTRAGDESVFFAIHASARPATWGNRVSWAVWLLRVLSFASPIECRVMVVSYFFVSLRSGHVCRWSILFRARIFRRWHCTLLYYIRTSVRYALITYCCASRSERNSSCQLCCSNGNRDSNTNATMRQQDLGAAAVCNRKHYDCC